MPSESYYKAFDGTPFKNVLWRLLGVRIGRRVFDDGCFLTERTFTAIGDDCTLNAGSVIQCHSQEDGAFKSDHTVLGAGCTLGVGAFVHYGVTMGDGAVLAPDSFLMKGEEIAPRGRWGGNPAIEFFDTVDDLRDVLVVDRTRPAGSPGHVRPGPDAGLPSTTRLPAALAATALSALIVLALSGGTAVAMGVPMPFRPAAAASTVPAATRPATPPPSSAPTSSPAAELTTTPEPAEPTVRAKRPGSTSAKASTSAEGDEAGGRRTPRRATTTPQRTTTTTPRATTTSPDGHLVRVDRSTGDATDDEQP